MIINRINPKKGIAIIITLSCLMIFSAGAAFASSGGDGHVVTAKTWQSTDTQRVMNFVVLAALLIVVLRKPVSAALNGRIETIRKDLSDLEKARVDAENDLKEFETKIATLEKEAELILNQYKVQGEAVRDKILDEAKKSAEKLKDQARKNIEHEFKAAKQLLQEELMEEALVKAEALIRSSITDKDQDQLVEEYLKKVVA
jgi:F-type H+-transporting ATPase subunit b